MTCAFAPQSRRLLLACAGALAILAPGAEAAADPAAGAVTRSYPARNPPYYRGEAPARQPVAWLPVRLVPGPGMPETWLPPALHRLAEDIGRRLTEQEDLIPWQGPALPAAGTPEVYLGCALDTPDWGECADDPREMVLAITGPGKKWRRAAAANEAGRADLVLITALTVADHWLRQKNLKGAKEIRLGTGHVQPVPWLTSLDTPVQVIQLTGLLVDREGRVVRAGAEGLMAVRTPFAASVGKLQRVISDEDAERLRTELRRDDLPGAPLVWEAALSTLLQQLR